MKISFSKKQYTIFASAVLFLLGLSPICVRIFSVHYSNVFFYSNEFSKNLGRVISLNGISKRNEVSKSKYVFYKFTDNQIAALNKIYKDSSPSSLTVRLGIKMRKASVTKNFSLPVSRFTTVLFMRMILNRPENFPAR